MLCARFVLGYQIPPDEKEHNNTFFHHNKQTKFAILTFWYPEQSASAALWDLLKVVNTQIKSLHSSKYTKLKTEFHFERIINAFGGASTTLQGYVHVYNM